MLFEVLVALSLHLHLLLICTDGFKNETRSVLFFPISLPFPSLFPSCPFRFIFSFPFLPLLSFHLHSFHSILCCFFFFISFSFFFPVPFLSCHFFSSLTHFLLFWRRQGSSRKLSATSIQAQSSRCQMVAPMLWCLQQNGNWRAEETWNAMVLRGTYTSQALICRVRAAKRSCKTQASSDCQRVQTDIKTHRQTDRHR